MKTKCDQCGKKVLFINICKCNKKFCMNHHYPEDHNCTFNFKEEYKKELNKLNPRIENKKIENI